jgi:hypothetical protein
MSLLFFGQDPSHKIMGTLMRSLIIFAQTLSN